MTRLLNFVPLIAAGAVLALTSAAQAQLLSDGGPSNMASPPFGTTINLSAMGDPNPVGDIGDPMGDATDNSTLTQLNQDTGFDFPSGNRTYNFTEVNVNALNLNTGPNGTAGVNENRLSVFMNCEINISDGSIGNDATLDVNSTLNMTDGTVNNGGAFFGVVNASSGNFGNENVFHGEVNLSGDALALSNCVVASGAVMNIDFDTTIVGSLDPAATRVNALDVLEGGTVNMSNGIINVQADISGVVNIEGGRLNSFAGIDGTVNVSNTNPAFPTILAASSEILDGGVVNVTTDNVTIFQNWTVATGGTLNMEGGILGSWNPTIVMAGVLNISGGGNGASNTASGRIGSGGVVNLSGGILGSAALTIEDGAVVNQTGGDLGFNTDVESGGVLNISGGTVGANQFATGDIDVDTGGTVNFSGTEFFIDGASIPGLTSGTTVTIAAADRGLLTGTLLDGTPVGSSLSSPATAGINLNAGVGDDFDAGAIITVTLSFALGDVNQSGAVNFLDIPAFIGVITGGGFQIEADINKDGAVDFLDIPLFIDLLT